MPTVSEYCNSPYIALVYEVDNCHWSSTLTCMVVSCASITITTTCVISDLRERKSCGPAIRRTAYFDWPHEHDVRLQSMMRKSAFSLTKKSPTVFASANLEKTSSN